MLEHCQQAGLEVVLNAGIDSFGGGGIEEARHAPAKKSWPSLEYIDNCLHGKDDC